MKVQGQACCHMSFISAFGRQKQVDLCEFEARLVYIVSSKSDKDDYIVKLCLRTRRGEFICK